MEEPDWNDLFLKWVQEIIDYIASKPNSLTNAYQTWTKAYRSLKSTDKKFNHPQKLVELKFFGPGICKKLTKKYDEYCKENGIVVPEESPSPVAKRGSKRAYVETGDGTVEEAPKKRKATKRAFVPKYRSGGYAILLTLYHHDSIHKGQGMDKASIVKLSEPLCDTSLKANPSVKSFYSAWNSVNTLIKNDLVYVSNSKNGLYYITEEGKSLAEKLLQAGKEAESQASTAVSTTKSKQSTRSESFISILSDDSDQGDTQVDCNNDIIASSPITSLKVSAKEVEFSPNTIVRNRIASMAPQQLPVSTSITNNSGIYRTEIWESGMYEVGIIIDNREIRNQSDRDFFQTELENQNVFIKVQPLSVGDALWIAHNKKTHQIAVLDHVCERKRLDDLIASIKDGRFTEQKGRLKRSGLQHIIYLVEEPAGLERGFYAQHTQTAMCQAVTHDMFYLKKTSSVEETVKYFARVTKLLGKLYKEKDLNVVWPTLTTTKAYIEDVQNTRSKLPSDTCLGIDYDTFQTALSKSNMLTIRDIYIRMLMTVRGITLDKAVTIQKEWPTPKALLDAYSSILTTEGKKLMISDKLGSGITRKKITPILSQKLYEVWGKM